MWTIIAYFHFKILLDFFTLSELIIAAVPYPIAIPKGLAIYNNESHRVF